MTEQVIDVKELEKRIDEIVDQHIIISGANEQIDTICETFAHKMKLEGKAATDMRSKLKDMGKKRFIMEYKREQYDKAREKALEVYDTLENLYGE